VQGANVAPILTNPGSQTTTTGQFVQLQLQATDANSDPLVFAASSLPAGLQLANTGRISGIPTTAGSYTVTATVTDGALSSQQVFSWLIRQANVAPTVTAPATQTSTAGDTILLQVHANDANGDTLTFAASGLPQGLQISSATGWISGTTSTAGTHTVGVMVSDGVLVTQRSFGWTVLAPPPVTQLDPLVTDTSLSGTKAVRRQPKAETTTRAYSGEKARPRTKTESTSSPTVDYTSSVAVTRSVATNTAPTVTYTSAAVMLRSETTIDTPGESVTTSLASTRSTAAEDTAETSQVVTSTASGTNAAAQTLASSGAPKLTIETPVAEARFAVANTIHFMATAKDYSGTDLSARIVWSSSVDGALGTGGSITKTLTRGTHIISARVTDRRGRTGTATVTIVVE
jgi:hypothetical protein